MVRLGGNLPPNFGFTRRLELLLMAAGDGEWMLDAAGRNREAINQALSGRYLEAGITIRSPMCRTRPKWLLVRFKTATEVL